jgi:hypothetical protein
MRAPRSPDPRPPTITKPPAGAGMTDSGT